MKIRMPVGVQNSFLKIPQTLEIKFFGCNNIHNTMYVSVPGQFILKKFILGQFSLRQFILKPVHPETVYPLRQFILKNSLSSNQFIFRDSLA